MPSEFWEVPSQFYQQPREDQTFKEEGVEAEEELQVQVQVQVVREQVVRVRVQVQDYTKEEHMQAYPVS